MPRKKRPSQRKDGENRGRPTMVSVVLTLKHNINGTSYGPGPVRVQDDIARVLLDNETRYEQAETRLHTDSCNLIIGGGRVIQRPAGFFDQPTDYLPIGQQILKGEW